MKIEVADPTTLGLFGLAIVTLVASSQKMELTSGLSLVLPWAILILRYASARSFANALRSDKSFYKAILRAA